MATITLKGFADIDAATMVKVKKQLGNFEQKELYNKEAKLSLFLKKIHAHEGKGGKAELHLKLDVGEMFNIEVVEFSVPEAVDAGLKKLSLLLAKNK
jgi:hypothetical protein